jgi:hypothetical protein
MFKFIAELVAANLITDALRGPNPEQIQQEAWNELVKQRKLDELVKQKDEYLVSTPKLETLAFLHGANVIGGGVDKTVGIFAVIPLDHDFIAAVDYADDGAERRWPLRMIQRLPSDAFADHYVFGKNWHVSPPAICGWLQTAGVRNGRA